MADQPAPSQRPAEHSGGAVPGGPDRPDRPVTSEQPVRKPIVAGLIALSSVAVVAGLLGGVIVIAGAKIFGVSEAEGGTSGAPSSGATLYLPEPTKTTGSSKPSVSLDVDPRDLTVEEEPEEEEEEADEGLTLAAGQTSVPSMGRIDLTGTYGTDGAILQVQRRQAGGDWVDFPVTAAVRGGAFSTYLMTGQAGKTEFRVVDTDSGTASEPVSVQIG
ncbi:hypothetical protein [Nocardioides yefusunii]|uniref:Bacterial spore germination immunoglobulin-like domain-containing protein n=1 Tax=Nocardioides yefusunii TaxID=2500546 RepID=A0ABW1QXA6_9ACTN|nr:hypothetical protein [Nocardioides yefusunii]